MVSWLGFSWRIFVISKWLIKWASTVPTREMQKRADKKHTQILFAGWPSWCDTKKPQWHVPEDLHILAMPNHSMPEGECICDKQKLKWHLKALTNPPRSWVLAPKILVHPHVPDFWGGSEDFKRLLLIIFMIVVGSWLFLKICTSTKSTSK